MPAAADIGVLEEELARDRRVAFGELGVGAGRFGASIAELFRESRIAAVYVESDATWIESHDEDAGDRKPGACTDMGVGMVLSVTDGARVEHGRDFAAVDASKPTAAVAGPPAKIFSIPEAWHRDSGERRGGRSSHEHG